MNQKKVEEFWKKEGLKHIKPSFLVYPEAFKPLDILKELITPEEVVLEIGCGTGRLSVAFKSENYIGFDINPEAIKKAEELYPGYAFNVIGEGDNSPIGYLAFDVALFYTVLLHVTDEAIKDFLRKYQAPKIVIGEMLGRFWRREGNPPVFNRNLEDYLNIFKELGYTLEKIKVCAYGRYEKEKDNFSFLVFRKTKE